MKKIKIFNCKQNIAFLLKKYLQIYLVAFFTVEVLLLAILFFISPTAAISTTSHPLPKQQPQPKEILKLINDKRRTFYLPPLSPDARLTTAARQRAIDIFHNQHFSHFNSQGEKFSQTIKEQQYLYRRAGENLALFLNSSQTVVDAWLDSPSHRRNLLNPYYRHTGIVVAKGYFKGKPAILVVQIFAQPIDQN